MHIPPPTYFAAAFLAGLVLHQWLPLSLTGDTWNVPRIVIGYCAMALAAAWGGWAIVTFWRHRTPVIPGRPARAMVVSGPYRWSRNPMYVGLFVLYAGLSLRLDLFWPLVFCPLLWLLLNYSIIAGEERHLTERFGDAFQDYCHSVRRWL
jgi:protein-S-isoprenylcysteine O-methyltransferase Ste14